MCRQLRAVDVKAYDVDESAEMDADVTALVQALPHIRALHLESYAALATNAGMQCSAMQS